MRMMRMVRILVAVVVVVVVVVVLSNSALRMQNAMGQVNEKMF